MAVNPPPDCQYVVMAQSVDTRQSALYAATWIIVTQSWAWLKVSFCKMVAQSW